MPETNDTVDIPIGTPGTVPGDGSSPPIGDSSMDVPDKMHETGLSRIESAGVSAHEHFITFGKVLDFAYEADRKMVSLVQSLGVREVTSQSGQLGIPNAAQSGAK